MGLSRLVDPFVSDDFLSHQTAEVEISSNGQQRLLSSNDGVFARLTPLGLLLVAGPHRIPLLLSIVYTSILPAGCVVASLFRADI